MSTCVTTNTGSVSFNRKQPHALWIYVVAKKTIRRPISCSICLCTPSFVSAIAVRPSMAYALPIACMPYAFNISFGILPRSPHRGFLPCPALPLAVPAYSAAAFLHCSMTPAPPAVLYTSHPIPHPLYTTMASLPGIYPAYESAVFTMHLCMLSNGVPAWNMRHGPEIFWMPSPSS